MNYSISCVVIKVILLFWKIKKYVLLNILIGKILIWSLVLINDINVFIIVIFLIKLYCFKFIINFCNLGNIVKMIV